jgi:RsiW-degrading membrane proteinase PrsW (M82 family)
VLPLFSPGPLLAALYHAFAVAAIPEELLKLSVVALYCARRVSFDEPMDGVVYGATAALGFAALENVLYVVGGGLAVALARSVTAVPMHAIMGAILGHYIARSRFLLEGRRLDIWKGWAIATLVHGLYDFGPMAILRLAEEETPLAGRGLLFVALLLLFLGVLITSGLSMRRLVRRLRTEQLEVQLCAWEEDSATAVPLGSPEAPQARGADVDRPGSSCLAEKMDPAPRDGRRQAP